MFYDNIRAACERKGLTLTEALHAIGRSSGSTGSWKSGKLPTLAILMELSDYLEISIDEMVYGRELAQTRFSNGAAEPELTDNQREWLAIIDTIPEDKQAMCKDFLRTHAAIPEKFSEGKMA